MFAIIMDLVSLMFVTIMDLVSPMFVIIKLPFATRQAYRKWEIHTVT